MSIFLDDAIPLNRNKDKAEQDSASRTAHNTAMRKKQKAEAANCAADEPARGKQRDYQFVFERLTRQSRLIEEEEHPPASEVGLRLTFDGWERFEKLTRETIESRLAFMAMGYHNPDVAGAFEECFVPAVDATGFELRKLDQKPKAGLIDVRMRAEIRTARFLVADLTDENRGAYWEAGFAEGLGRPVFYTCEQSKFDRVKTHFDTEHLQTIKWSLDNLNEPAQELKAMIRNELPTEAKLRD